VTVLSRILTCDVVGMSRPDGTILAEATSSVGLNSVQSPSVPPLPPCKVVVIYRVKRRLQSELARVSERSGAVGIKRVAALP
jgi:hypothetical protein